MHRPQQEICGGAQLGTGANVKARTCVLLHEEMADEDRCLVFRWSLDVIDNQNLEWSLRRFTSETDIA